MVTGGEGRAIETEREVRFADSWTRATPKAKRTGHTKGDADDHRGSSTTESRKTGLSTRLCQRHRRVHEADHRRRGAPGGGQVLHEHGREILRRGSAAAEDRRPDRELNERSVGSEKR